MERVQIRNIVLINIMLLKPLQRNNNCVSLAIWMMWVNRKWASKLDYGAYHMLIQCIINNHKKMKHRYVDLNFKVIELYFNVYSFLKSFWNLMYVNGIYITNFTWNSKLSYYLEGYNMKSNPRFKFHKIWNSCC